MTLVKRQTRYIMLAKIDSKDSATVVNALVKHARKLLQELYKSPTWDRGPERHNTSASLLLRRSKSTSVKLIIPGNAARTRTRVAS